ncbi:TonB-dependent receptor [uncultured Sphingomonas sp.]|uniref:TonB-dependent receptor n=1 Tax=uncultured Sphingomonas sp. TaxID=158754 RepID=UPI0035CB505A
MGTDRYALLAATAMVSMIAAPARAADPNPTGAAAQTGAQGRAGDDVGSARTESTDDAGAGQSENVIVTAQKREQSLIDVPQSVSVVSGATLERQQATNFQDYLKLVPGLQLNQDTQGVGRLILRGINTGGVASTVAVYVDETTFGSSSGQANGAIQAGDFDTFDVARIEVLRGPQGTLYGASSLGGVLKFVTNAPQTDSIEARGRASVETVDGGDLSYFGSALVNLPVGDKLAIRATGFYRKFGGFIDSVGTGGSDTERNINDSRSYGGRGSLLFKPSDAFSVRLTAFVQNIENDASTTVESDFFGANTLFDRRTQSQFVPEFTDVRYRVYSGVASLDLGFADLISATSYSTIEQRFRTDLTTQFSPIVEAVFEVPNEFLLNQTTEVKRFTQEVRLQSAVSDTFEWLLGGFYTREKGEIDQAFAAVNPGTLTPVAGLPLLGTALVPSRYREIAGFANATVHLGERFDLTFGGRYSENKQRASTISDGVLAGGPSTLPTARSTEDVFTYSVAPKFKLNDRSAIYARVAKGYRPGGPNVLPPNPPADTPRTFDSDTVVSYEVGIKAETADRGFSIDLAAFHIDWNDIQLFAVVNDFGINTNGGKARSDGVEFTATLRPTTGFNLSVNGAYTDAKLRDDAPPLVGGLDGDRLPFTPRYSIGVNGDYEWSLGGDARAFVGSSLRFLSDQPGGFDPEYSAEFGRQRYLEAYEVVDFRAGVDFGRFSIEAYARNATNSEGKTSAGVLGNVPGGAIQTGIVRPRSFGLTLGAGI